MSTEHISIRLPKYIVDFLRKQAELEQRSLSWIIGYRLAQLTTEVKDGIARGDTGDQGKDSEGDSGGRRTDGNAVPILPQAAKSTKRLHTVSAVRAELAGRGGHGQEPSSEPGTISLKCEKAGHRNIRAGERWICLTCKDTK